MTKMNLPATLLAMALAVGGASVTATAGHTKGEGPYGHTPQFMAHHGFMQQGHHEQRPARLGVAISAISQGDLDGVSLEYGVRVAQVMEASVAEQAGLQAGDIVTDIDGRPAYSPERLQHLVAQAGDTAAVTVQRAGEALQLQARFAVAEAPEMAGRAVLGIRIQEMTEELKEAFGASDDRGVLISQVVRGSAARQAGLKAGDVVVAIDGQPIGSVEAVHSTLSGYSPGDSVQVSILRDRQETGIEVALGGTAMASAGRVKQPHGMHGYHGHGHHGSKGMMPRHHCQMSGGQRPS